MNILLVTETYLPYITGVSISTDYIARFLTENGHKVTLLTPEPLISGNVKPESNLEVVHVPSIPFKIYNNNPIAILPSAVIKIKKLITKKHFNVVHIQEPGATGISTLILAKMKNIPIVGALHFIPQQIDRVIWGKAEYFLTPVLNHYIRFVYNQYDQIMTPSRFFANYLKKVGVKKPINVISNGVDTNLFRPGQKNTTLRNKYGIGKDDFVFYYMGRLDGDKNVETLVKAMRYTDKHVKILIVGNGKNKTRLHNLGKTLGAEKKIIWIDYIADEDKSHHYHAVDAFVIMSPYEGQSIVSLDAIATGLPIIAANAGALPEICHDEENGFLVEPYDNKTLAQKMNELANSKTLVKKFGLESRIISLMHHKPKVLHSLELIFKNLADKN